MLILLPFQWSAAPMLARQKQLRFKKAFKHWLKEHWQELPVHTFSGEVLKEVVWIESHEFEYRGDMYDVVQEYHSNGGERSVVCVKDDIEKKLKKQFRSLHGGKGKYPADTHFSAYTLNEIFSISIRKPPGEVLHTPYLSAFSLKSIRLSFRPPDFRIHIQASLMQD